MAKCVVCSEPVRHPKLLSCLHSVCSLCIQHIARDALTLSCPNCQRLTSVLSVFSLPNDYVNAAIADSSREQQAHCCEECALEREATCKCVECGLLLCNVHEQGHKLSRSTATHKLQMLSSDEEAEGLSSIPRCALHPFRPLSLFCKTCSKSLCEQCREAGAHGGQSHTVMPSNEAARQQRQELNDMRQKITEPSKSTEIRTALDEVIRTINALNSAAETASAEIGRNVDDLVAVLRQRERELLDKLEELRWQKLEPLEKQREDLEKRLSDAERTNHYCKAAVDRLKDEQLLESTGWLRENLQNVAGFTYSGPASDSYVAFLANRDSLDACLAVGFGCVTNKQADPTSSSLQTTSVPQPVVEGKATKVQLNACLVGGQRFSGDLGEIGMKVEVTNPNNEKCSVQIVQEGAEGNFTISFTPDSVGQHHVAAMVNNQHVRDSPLTLDVKPFLAELTQSWRQDGGEFTTVSNNSPVTLPQDWIASEKPFQLQLVIRGKREECTVITDIGVNVSSSNPSLSCNSYTHSYSSNCCGYTGRSISPIHWKRQIKVSLQCPICSHSPYYCNCSSTTCCGKQDGYWQLPLSLQTSIKLN